MRDGVLDALMHMHRAIEVNEGEYDGEDCVLVYGRTADDLHVAFRVRIDQPWRVDA